MRVVKKPTWEFIVGISVIIFILFMLFIFPTGSTGMPQTKIRIYNVGKVGIEYKIMQASKIVVPKTVLGPEKRHTILVGPGNYGVIWRGRKSGDKVHTMHFLIIPGQKAHVLFISS